MINSEIRSHLDWFMYVIGEFHSGFPEEDYDGENDELLTQSQESYKHLRSYFKDDNN
jgi:hypothetical protein